jgi:hypothetical protein
MDKKEIINKCLDLRTFVLEIYGKSLEEKCAERILNELSVIEDSLQSLEQPTEQKENTFYGKDYMNKITTGCNSVNIGESSGNTDCNNIFIGPYSGFNVTDESNKLKIKCKELNIDIEHNISDYEYYLIRSALDAYIFYSKQSCKTKTNSTADTDIKHDKGIEC